MQDFKVLQTNGSGVLSFATPSSATNTPAFRAVSNTDQSISTSVATKVNFATENYDTDSAFSSGTFTVPSGKNGIYQINTGVVCRSTSNNITAGVAIIYKNGSILVSQYVNFDTSQDLRNHFISINTALELAVSDTIEIYVLIVATSPIISSTDGGTFFNMYKIIQ